MNFTNYYFLLLFHIKTTVNNRNPIMKFLSVFSTVLCALALRINALPVTEEPYALVSRAADQTTAAYDRAIAIKSDMIPGIRYVFTIKL